MAFEKPIRLADLPDHCPKCKQGMGLEVSVSRPHFQPFVRAHCGGGCTDIAGYLRDEDALNIVGLIGLKAYQRLEEARLAAD